MLLTLLLYGYCRGVYSSRKIAAGCASGVAFRVLSGGQFPDFRTVSDFRKNHLEAFQGRFIEVLRLCREAGMVRLGHLSLDGSKYQANASRHKAMSYGRMAAAADQLEAEVQELLDRAAAVDAAEDAEYGAAVRGDELPEELRRREERLTRIKDAKTRLEERARSRARDESQRKGATEEVAAAASVQAKPQPREPSNFTDPDRRMMKSPQGWVQGYNAQIMVEESSGVIVAQEVSSQGVDTRRLGPMLGILEQNLTRLGVPETERCPRLFTDGAGYCSEGSLRLLADRGIDAYVATGRARHHRAGIGGGVPGRHSAAFRHEGQVADAGETGDLCPAQNHHRAGVRVHQAGPGLPAVPVARRRRGVGRIHPDSPHPQPVEAVARRHGGHRVATG